MAENTGWYKTGAEGFKAKDQQDVAMAMRKERGVPRFMLKAGEEAMVVMVDDPAFFVWEHNLRVNGRWGNYLTCPKEIKVCDTCSTGDKSTYTGYMTCIDLRTFIRKDGTKVTKRKILYPAKGSTIKRIEDLKKKHGSLKGLVFKIKRYTKDDPNCGTDFEYIKTVTLTGDYATPIDYAKVLALATQEELQALGITSTIAGQQGNLELGALEAPPPAGAAVAGEPSAGATTTNDFSDIF